MKNRDALKFLQNRRTKRPTAAVSPPTLSLNSSYVDNDNNSDSDSDNDNELKENFIPKSPNCIKVVHQATYKKENMLALTVEHHSPIRNPSVSSSMMDSKAIKTPLRGNVSAKHTSNEQTARTIISELCYNNAYNAHVISGARGVGKSFVAYKVVQLPLAKKTFTGGVVWLGLGSRRSMQYDDLIGVYEQICTQLLPGGRKRFSFDDVLFVPSAKPIKSEVEKQEEKRAMFHARDIMSRIIGDKDVLIGLDGMFDTGDIKYFQFQSVLPSKAKCRVLASANTAPFEIEKVKSWQLSNMNTVDARELFLKPLSSNTMNHPDFLSSYGACHLSCHGNPLSIIALSKLVDDKIESENYKSLKKFATKFESAPLDPKMQIFIMLENSFSHSSLGEAYTKVAWRCFAAFCAVFTRDNCVRPFIPRSPIRALFRAVIERVGNISDETHVVAEAIDKVIDFMVKLGMITFIDGFDGHKSPRQFYQVSSDVYQEFGEQLSANKETHRKLHELLINEYTDMFTGINAAFGSNEIDFYMLKFLPAHSMKANEFEDVSLTLQDARFIEERIKYMGIQAGCQKHIEDTEAMAELVRVKSQKMASLILATSYQNCTRVLATHCSNDENGTTSTRDKRNALNGMWKLAFSLLKHLLVSDACKVLQKAKELDGEDGDNSVIQLDSTLINGLSRTLTDNPNQCSRALILIGSAMAQTGMKRRDAVHLLSSGLRNLEESLGAGTLEVARAHVYIGEIFYRDFKMYKHALQYFRNALPSFMRELGEDSEELYDAIILIGKSCIHTGDLDTALDILRNISPKLKGSIALDVNIKVGYIYIIKGNHEKAAAVLNKAKQGTSDKAIIERIDQLIEKSVRQSGRCVI